MKRKRVEIIVYTEQKKTRTVSLTLSRTHTLSLALTHSLTHLLTLSHNDDGGGRPLVKIWSILS